MKIIDRLNGIDMIFIILNVLINTILIVSIVCNYEDLYLMIISSIGMILTTIGWIKHRIKEEKKWNKLLGI